MYITYVNTKINTMKKITLIIVNFLLLVSCSDRQQFLTEDDTINNFEKGVFINDSIDNLIIELNEEDFPKRPEISLKTRSWDYDDEFIEYVDIKEELSQLQGIHFFIQSVDYNYGNNTWETNGKGKELKLSPFNQKNQSQKFYLYEGSLSMLADYYIYSAKEGVPVGIGSYANNPGTYIMYSKANNKGSFTGFSWSFSFNENNDAYIPISQDIYGEVNIPNAWWAVTYYSPSVYNKKLTTELNNTSLTRQQVVFIPDDEFNILKIDFDFDLGSILSTKNVVLEQNIINNPKPITIEHTYVYEKTHSNQSSFTEKKSITTSKSGGLNLSIPIPKVGNIGFNNTITAGASTDITYSTNSTITTRVSKTYKFSIPPNSYIPYTFSILEHKLSVPYTATVKGARSNKILKIRGIWEGVDYSRSEFSTGSAVRNLK